MENYKSELEKLKAEVEAMVEGREDRRQSKVPGKPGTMYATFGSGMPSGVIATMVLYDEPDMPLVIRIPSGFSDMHDSLQAYNIFNSMTLVPGNYQNTQQIDPYDYHLFDPTISGYWLYYPKEIYEDTTICIYPEPDGYVTMPVWDPVIGPNFNIDDPVAYILIPTEAVPGKDETKSIVDPDPLRPQNTSIPIFGICINNDESPVSNGAPFSEPVNWIAAENLPLAPSLLNPPDYSYNIEPRDTNETVKPEDYVVVWGEEDVPFPYTVNLHDPGVDALAFVHEKVDDIVETVKDMVRDSSLIIRGLQIDTTDTGSPSTYNLISNPLAVSLINHSTWIFTSHIQSSDPVGHYGKGEFTEGTREMFETVNDLSISSLPKVEQRKIESNIEEMWMNIENIGLISGAYKKI